MYFPVLRGRREELFALEGCTAIVAAARKVMPVIEPAAAQSVRLTAILTSGVTCCLIVNPSVGDYAGATLPTQFQVLSSHPNIIPTLIIDGGTAAQHVADFVAIHPGRRAFYYKRIPAHHSVIAATVAAAVPTLS